LSEKILNKTTKCRYKFESKCALDKSYRKGKDVPIGNRPIQPIPAFRAPRGRQRR